MDNGNAMDATLLDFLMFSNGMILIFLGFIQMSYKRKVLNNYLAIVLFALTGAMILYNWGFKTGFIYPFPYLINADIIVSYVLAPCIYLYFRSISNKPTRPFRHYVPYFLPGVAVLGFSIVYHLVQPEVAAAYLATRPITPPYLQKNLLSHLNTLGDMAVAAAFVYAFWENRFLFKQRNLLQSGEFRTVFVFITCMIFDSVLVLVAQVMGQPGLLMFALNGYGIILIVYSFFTYRYPEFMQIVLREVKSLKYAQSQLQHVDVDGTIQYLDDMMHKGKLYKDEKLTLAKVSQLLGITSHQLSELINTHRQQSFPAFVNQYRVEEAKKLLVTRPKMTVLEIAYDSGFKSKASFNAAFSEYESCTPTQYRKKHKTPGH